MGAPRSNDNDQARPGLFAPWLAIGVGLAGLAALPGLEVGSPASAEPAAPIVHPVAATAAVALLALELPDTGQLGLQPSGAAPAPAPAVPELVPARIDGLFSVTGTSVRPPRPLEVAPPRTRPPVVRAAPAPAPPAARAAAPAPAPPAPATVAEAPPPPPPPPPSPPVARTPSGRVEPTGEQWAALRWCESRGDYGAISASGRFRGAYQFHTGTWEAVGGVGDPAAAAPGEQDLRARLLYDLRGSDPWPRCGRHLP